MHRVPFLTVVLACLITISQALAQSRSERGVGYPSIEAALEALKARPGVRISVHDGWTIVDDPTEKALWSFTPPDHPAHPAVVKRYTAERDGQVGIQMRALCQASKAACDRLVAEFEELNKKIGEDIRRRAQTGQARWAPSEEQKSRAVETLGQFLRAVDEARYREAYEMFTLGMKSMMTFDRFLALEEAFKAKSGGEPVRTETRATWYKDPPQASAPGVYAAFNIRCSFRNINLCEEVVILHEQANGQFHVMRQERNVVDKDTEQKLRERGEKREGS